MIADLKVLARDYWKTLIHPSPLTFYTIASHAQGRLILSMVMAILIIEISLFSSQTFLKTPIETILRFALEYLFVIPVLVLLWAFFIYKICLNMFRRKKSDYEMMLYVLIVITAVSEVFTFVALPISLLSPVVSEVVVWAGWIYKVILAAIAIYAVARLPIWQSILTVVISAVLAGVGGFALILFFSAIMRSVPFVL